MSDYFILAQLSKCATKEKKSYLVLNVDANNAWDLAKESFKKYFGKRKFVIIKMDKV